MCKTLMLAICAAAALQFASDGLAGSRATTRRGLPSIGGKFIALKCYYPVPIGVTKKTKCPTGYAWYHKKHKCCRGVVQFPPSK